VLAHHGTVAADHRRQLGGIGELVRVDRVSDLDLREGGRRRLLYWAVVIVAMSPIHGPARYACSRLGAPLLQLPATRRCLTVTTVGRGQADPGAASSGYSGAVRHVTGPAGVTSPRGPFTGCPHPPRLAASYPQATCRAVASASRPADWLSLCRAAIALGADRGAGRAKRRRSMRILAGDDGYSAARSASCRRTKR
jgi:hypothetical protein